MKNENLLQLIEQEFKDVTLGDNYTLAEEDYADTSYWYFDKQHPDSNLTAEEWASQELGFFETCAWLAADKEEAIQAIKEKRKMANRFSNPLEIPSLYLNMHFTGFSYLAPQAYLFYTPAIMKHYLSDADSLYSNSFTWWLTRLRRANNPDLIKKVLQFFVEQQIVILEEFLMYVFKSNNENNDVKVALENLKQTRKM
ncbi:hypothetical protein GCM10025882_31620 [Acinetobacter gyllenbergii]|uniref:Uncharacterized protein n=1 Tax=Acinetobacter gyllenbergii CIP 110306 = MTCC 11365 TaxID=1217657 RepID=A0A829HBB8_9GAMM|nr:DUF6714 family protein [Acinetobacter gyllenbergii]EPF72536.1 hypothetical protein F957_03672 [Acinetobacter gyllenbergii CIP 110306 = MTCC 11365]EPH31061.1 hypothetical protein L293_2464 [Acinetobacter gyllenbergii CIP 110306 = MTCC 11365]GMA12737.1 hypothetical protein GCM10025882_31620 [Acinetobacter gyllenbergii]